MKHFKLIMVILLIISIKAVSYIKAQPQRKRCYLIHFNRALAEQDLQLIFNINQQDILYKYHLLNVYHLKLTDKQAKNLSNNSEVKTIERDSRAHTYEVSQQFK